MENKLAAMRAEEEERVKEAHRKSLGSVGEWFLDKKKLIHYFEALLTIEIPEVQGEAAKKLLGNVVFQISHAHSKAVKL